MTLAIKFSKQDCNDILDTAAEGGVNHWAYVTRTPDRNDGTGSGARLHLTPVHDDDDFTPRTICALDVLEAMREVLERFPAGTHAVHAINAQDVDAEAADVIVQFAMFGRVVFG